MNAFSISNSHINIFKSVFKGREDVFAIRWEKGKKSGYMPAYVYDPYMYRRHKMRGGSFKDYKNKSYQPLTDEQIFKHLNGEQLIGVYPLLKDNKSWFIVADFDKENWEKECQAFIDICRDYHISVYLERSRSGNGGHVWMFFDRPYPAIRSRKVIISLLEKAGIFSVFDKNSSFDRLFPNQDFLSGKGLGNLIALPLHNTSWINGNSCFIDPASLVPHEDQWNFLQNIERVATSKLDKYYDSFADQKLVTNSLLNPKNPISQSTNISIQLDNVVSINRSSLTASLITYLKEELNFYNPEYAVKKNLGKSTWGVKRYIKYVEEAEHEVRAPRGVIGRLIRFCRENGIEYQFNDLRKKCEDIHYLSKINLRKHQTSAIETTSKKDFGVIVAPPGAGKTVIGLKIIEQKQQPALIIVHRKHIADQWIERIEAFLGIPAREIGKIGQGKNKIGKKITVALIQTLAKKLIIDRKKELINAFGLIIVDECHHIPAETFSKTITQLKSYYQYGLTATPFRKLTDGKLIFLHLGDIIVDIKPQQIESYKKAKVIVRATQLDVPFNSKTDQFETLSKILIHDSTRNNLILQDIKKELDNGKKVVIITERKDHIQTLYQYLKQNYEVVALSGNDSESNRKSKWAILHDGNYQAVITTGQYFGEGTDLQNASCLFLVYPFSFKGKLIQYIGRVQRTELTPYIYDYRDRKIDYLNKLFLKRNTYYRQLERQASLFDDIEPEPIKSKSIIRIAKPIKVLIENLDFRYGSFAFVHHIAEISKDLEFEIEHDDIRPEFDVLKPYFEKILKKKQVLIHISAEFEGEHLMSQLAESEDLARINREVIESVKFKFLDHAILKGKFSKDKSNQNLLKIDQLRADGDSPFNSEEELINSILTNKSVKHYNQLRYLAKNHAYHILKIRFVLQPFAFVFLLIGEEQFHIVLETLDTEEATYIWHIAKEIRILRNTLKQIDDDLGAIRNQGRKSFIENPPANFSRVFHDYIDERKGFVVWKDLLEERLA